MALQVVLVSEDIVAEAADEAARGGVAPEVGAAHDLCLEAPRAARVGAGEGPRLVVDPLVLPQGRPVHVGCPAHVADDTVVAVHLAVGVDENADGGGEVTLAATVQLCLMCLAVGCQVGLGLEGLAAVRTQEFLVRPVGHLVFAQVTQSPKHLPTRQ